MSRRTASRALCGILLTSVTPLFAQETKLDREVDFVRRLATELRFTSLARQEVERLQTANRDSDDFKKVFQLGIEISLIGARSHPNREERRTLFKDALQSSKEFIDRYSDEPVAIRARRTMISACYEYGAYLLEEIDIAREDNPEQVAELEEQTANVYRDGIDACAKVMEDLETGAAEVGSEAQRDYFVTWLFTGMLQREMARAVKRDRIPLSQIARDTFEDFIFEVGEETLLGLRGWFEMSKIGEVLGNYEVAFDDFESTVVSIRITLDSAADLGLTQETQEYIFNLLQEASDGAADALFQQGKIDETLAFVDTFREDLKTYGEEGAEPFEIAHPTYGHPVFLTEARALAESGESDKVARALEMAQLINNEHPNDITGLRAKKVLKEILHIQTGVSGALLFEIAKGDYQEQDYERAVQGFKRAFGAMTPAEKSELGLETWASVAKCFALQGRFLEASLAAKRALDDHGDTPEGRPENTTEFLERVWNRFKRDATNHDVPSIARLNDGVTATIAKFGGKGSAAKLSWRDALRKLDNGAYAEAAALFARVPPDTPYYEPAQARIVVAWQGEGDHPKAHAAIKAYLDWLQTPAAQIPSDRRELFDTRRQALATVQFYGAYMDYLESVGTVGGAPDPTRFEPTITKLRAFIVDHGANGPTYVPDAWNMVARLQAELGQIDRAEESYRILRRLAPNSPRVPQLATAIFKAHYDTVKALVTEFDASIERGAETSEIEAIEARLLTARRATVASGLEYLDNSAQPQYGVLYTAMTIAGDMKDWPKAERFGRKVVELFGNDTEHSDKIERFVTARLGEALLHQQKFRDAVAVLQTAAAANPNNYPVKRFLSLAQGGWFEFNTRGDLTEIAGMDDPIPAYKRHWTEYRKYLVARDVPKFTLEWYEFHCECFMFTARAAKKDSKYAATRDTLYGIARSIDEFSALRRLGPQGERLYNLFVSVR